RAVLGANALGQLRERELADLLEHLHDRELRPGQVGATRPRLRDAAALRIEIDDRLEDLVHVTLDFRADRRGRHYLACEISVLSRPSSTSVPLRSSHGSAPSALV